MQEAQPSLFTRPDTLLGVCEGLGEDLRFNPLFLRLALTMLLFFSPMVAVGLYLGLGGVVLLTRLLFPIPRASTAVEAEAEAAQPDEEPLPIAA